MTLEDLTALNSICNDLSRLVIADYFADKDMTWVERELRNPLPNSEAFDGFGVGFGGYSSSGSGGGTDGGCSGDGGSGSQGSIGPFGDGSFGNNYAFVIFDFDTGWRSVLTPSEE